MPHSCRRTLVSVIDALGERSGLRDRFRRGDRCLDPGTANSRGEIEWDLKQECCLAIGNKDCLQSAPPNRERIAYNDIMPSVWICCCLQSSVFRWWNGRQSIMHPIFVDQTSRTRTLLQ